MEINKINFNGKEYEIRDKLAEVLINELLGRIDELEELTEPVKELDSFSYGDIFVGAVTVTDNTELPITYDYLTSLMGTEAGKSFANTDKPITVRYSWEWGEKVGNVIKSFFILIPMYHTNLYSLEGEGNCVSNWESRMKYVTIDFPTGARRYKYYLIYGSAANFSDTELTYKF